MTLRHFDRQGNQITFMESFELIRNDPEYYHVALDKVDAWVVSTIWLPIEHGCDSEGRPLIFETQVITPDGTLRHFRNAIESEAMETHAWAIRNVKGLDE
jgi:hypothetical protein